MVRWVVVAACAVAIACGDGGSKKGDGGQASCVPSTCATLGASCGTIADGCGGALACGDCASGRSCGASGRPNVCTAVASCAPATCASLGKDCGPMPDGCGGMLECGSCSGGKLCGVGGTANVCAVPPVSCAPATCASLGKDCGTVPNGCGAELACGTCADGKVCGAGSTANVCAAPPPEPEVRWYERFGGPGDEQVVGVAVDDAGRRSALSTRTEWLSGTQEVVLRRVDADGKRVGERRWTGRTGYSFRLQGAPGGELLVHVSGWGWCGDCSGPELDLGGGPLSTGESLVALAADGAFRWQALVEEGPVSFAPRADGGAVVSTSWGGIRRLAADGAVVWSVPGDGRVCTVDPAGDAICAFQLSWERPSVTRVQKLAARDGTTIWTRDVTGLQQPVSVGTSDQGTVAMLGWRSGDIDVGPDPVREGGMALVVLEPDGRPRWARGTEVVAFATLAIDPTGRVAVVGTQQSCGAIAVHAWRLGGERLRDRIVPTDGACWTGLSLGGAVYGRDHLLTLGGWFWGTLRLGDERLQPEGLDGIVMTLSP